MTYPATSLLLLALCTQLPLVGCDDTDPTTTTTTCPSSCSDEDKIAICRTLSFVHDCIELEDEVTITCITPCREYSNHMLSNTTLCTVTSTCGVMGEAWNGVYLFVANLTLWYPSLGESTRIAVAAVFAMYAFYFATLAPVYLFMTFALGGPLLGAPIGFALSLSSGLYEYEDTPGRSTMAVVLSTSVATTALLLVSRRASAAVLSGCVVAAFTAAVVATMFQTSHVHSTHGVREVLLAVLPSCGFCVGCWLSSVRPLYMCVLSCSAVAGLLTTQCVANLWDESTFIPCNPEHPGRCVAAWVVLLGVWGTSVAFTLLVTARCFQWDSFLTKAERRLQRLSMDRGSGEITRLVIQEGEEEEEE